MVSAHHEPKALVHIQAHNPSQSHTRPAPYVVSLKELRLPNPLHEVPRQIDAEDGQPVPRRLEARYMSRGLKREKKRECERVYVCEREGGRESVCVCEEEEEQRAWEGEAAGQRVRAKVMHTRSRLVPVEED